MNEKTKPFTNEDDALWKAGYAQGRSDEALRAYERLAILATVYERDGYDWRAEATGESAPALH